MDKNKQQEDRMMRNVFVDFINQFYSQNDFQSAAYAELSRQRLEGISLKVDKIIDDLAAGLFDFLILTGNAGDGKTFICNQLYKRLTGDSLPNQPIIKEKKSDQFDLYIVKDASEIPSKKLEQFLRYMENRLHEAYSSRGDKKKKRKIFILAGNEGKLSEAIDKAKLSCLRDLFEDALIPKYEDEKIIDEASPGKLQGHGMNLVKVINFNWRDLTGIEAFKSIILSFVQDRKNWEAYCDQCPSSSNCPIYLNARMLRHDEIIESIRLLFRFFRYLNGHFTLRELFSAIAYILTASRNCQQIHQNIENKQQLDYMFYNNIFSRHESQDRNSFPVMDRVLHKLQSFDVAVAPLPDVNKKVEKIHENKNYSGNNGIQGDLKYFTNDKDDKLPLLNALKRRIYFCKSQDFWGQDLYEILDQNPTVDHFDFFPFSCYKDFDAILTGGEGIVKESEAYNTIKSDIEKGLNLLANRNDSTAHFWLKVYRPSDSINSTILEFFGDCVESIDVYFTRKIPIYDPNYIEFANTELFFCLKVDNDNESVIRLPISITLYEGLRAAAWGNQSMQGLRYHERVIREFRESLFYRILSRIGSRKFLLYSPGNDKPVEVYRDPGGIKLRR